MVKLKDILNEKVNKKNHQIGFDLRKKALKKLDLDIDDILNMTIKEKKKWA
jgi:hypothetical protein